MSIKSSFETKSSLVFNSVISELFEKPSGVYDGKYRAAFRTVKHLPNLKAVNFFGTAFLFVMHQVMHGFKKLGNPSAPSLQPSFDSSVAAAAQMV